MDYRRTRFSAVAGAGAVALATATCLVGVGLLAAQPAAAASPVTRVGSARVQPAHPTRVLRLAAPAAALPGDLLLTSVGLDGTTAGGVGCPAGWHRLSDLSAAREGRLIECWAIDRQRNETATVHLRRRVLSAAVTTAYRGVSTLQPFARVAGSQGAHVVADSEAGALPVLTAVAAVHHAVAAPRGSKLLASVRGSAPLQLAIATSNSPLSATWRTSSGSATVNNVVTLQSSAAAPAASSAISDVGSPVSATTTGGASLKTAFPVGTGATDLVVSTIETYSASAVSCPSGWKAAAAAAATNGVRATTCYAFAGSATGDRVAISPATEAAMVTVAFRGVNQTSPVDTSSGTVGLTSPAVQTAASNELLVLAEGSNSWTGAASSAPNGSTLLTTINNGNNSQLAVATAPAASAGTTASYPWPVTPQPSTSVATTLALVPATSTTPVTPSPSATGSSGSPSSSPTGPSTPIASVGTATRASTASAAQLSTAFPTGVKSSDLLVSAVETYSFADVSCPAGWTRAVDQATGANARVAVCYGWAGSGTSATIGISPATQATAVTAAFRNVNQSSPVGAATAASGLSSPSVSAAGAGAESVLAEGSSGWQVAATGTTHATLLGSANDGGNSQAALASAPVAAAGPTGSYNWSVSPPTSDAVSATLLLSPASAGGGATAPSSSSPVASNSPTPAPTISTSSATPTPTPTPTTSSATPAPSTSSATPTPTPTSTGTSGGGTGSAPASPPVTVCGNNTLLAGPSAAPAGATTISTSQDFESIANSAAAGTTFWLTAGVHTLESGQYDQIQPKTGDTFIGAPGAIIDGQDTNLYAFTGSASDVTIEYLTVQNFGPAGANQDEGVVNHDSGTGWTLKYDTITDNAGAGTMLGSDDVVQYTCLSGNGQYGFNAYNPAGPAGLVIDHNEITGNNTYNWEAKDPGCGCTGGGKFWDVNGATVTDNYVHDNRGVGLWADTNNRGFDIEGNYISGNDNDGVIYEISYNALIQNNTFIRNGLVAGPSNPGFPTGAIYISESGADSRVAGPYGDTFEIADNDFQDNWSGVVLWENADRFCNSPANTSTGVCTLVNPSQVTEASCNATNIASAPYYSDCRWKTQNLLVTGNTFSFSTSDLGSGCTPANGCGLNGLFSNYGSYPSWSPYQGTKIEDAITSAQNNHFTLNTYVGPWEFMVHDQSNIVSLATWQSTYGQD